MPIEINTNNSANLLDVINLKKHKNGKQSNINAVDEMGFSIKKGQRVGLIGESGSGKSTLRKLLLLLKKPDEGGYLF